MPKILSSLAVILFATSLSAQTSFISGAVAGADDGRPLGNMSVAAYTLTGNLAATTATDGQGRYTLALAPGSYHLLAYDEGGTYATNYYSNASSFDTSATLTTSASQPLASINFALVRGVRVSGTVVSSSSQALSGMVVSAYNLVGTRRGHTRTNSSGFFSLVLPPGQYKFVAWDEDFGKAVIHVPEYYSHESSFDAATTVSLSSAISGIDFTLVPGAKVFGRITDRITGQPIGGIVVDAYDLSGVKRFSGETNENGDFQFALSGGAYKFVAFDPEQRYALSFYRNAGSFAGAASFSVTPGQSVQLSGFMLAEAQAEIDSVLYVAAAANSPGANNTFFQTDVWIQNPSGSEPLTVAVTFLPGGQDNTQRPSVNVTVAPLQQLLVPNVLQSLFQTGGGGALRLAAAAPFLVTSRTYNNPSNASEVGTYGLSFPGLTLADSMGRGTIAGLSNNASYRSNVGVLNPQPYAINLQFALYDEGGALLGEGTRPLLPLEWFQANTIFSFLNVNTTADGAYLVINSTEGSFFAYGSVVDQKSGDGTVIMASPD